MADARRRTLLTPTRALAAAVLVVGVGVLAKNGREPDESAWAGGGLVLGALTCLLGPERASRRRALEAAAVLLLVLAGAEIAVRRENARAQREYASRQMRFVDDPELLYEFRPGATCGRAQPHSRGMLDVERTVQKPTDTLRIACLGDSVGGDCELPRENACAALEEELSRALGGRRVESLNFSVPGYNTLQEARALELKARPFRPDAVVVLYVVNDPYPDLAIAQHLPGHFKFAHLLWSGTLMAASRVVPSLDPLSRGIARLHEQERAWDGVIVRGFDRIAAEARGAPVVVAIFPLFLEPQPEPMAGVHQKVAAEARRYGFTAIDLAAQVYRGEPLTAFLKPTRDVIHPDARAHRLAAQAVARALAEARPAWKAP